MSGDSLLMDTNIAIYHWNGDRTLESILQDKEIYISFITEIEISSKVISKDYGSLIKQFLFYTNIVHSNDSICQNAIALRRKYSIKTPDAIVAATAMHLRFPLLTADKQLWKINEAEVIQYQSVI